MNKNRRRRKGGKKEGKIEMKEEERKGYNNKIGRKNEEKRWILEMGEEE